jgi:release factor glutamine methyltransferase
VKTLLDIVNLSAHFLQQRGIQRARREAEELIAAILDLRRIDLYLQFEKPLIEPELRRLRRALDRRGRREPFSYVVGRVTFSGVTLQVTPAVLVPRPETEILVEKIKGVLAKEELRDKILWDCCTGSGCIAISLKKRFPQLSVIATDLCPKALAVAQQNAVANGVEITFLQGDLFSPMAHQQCDFFVSNPPYIAQKEFFLLDPEVRNYEPKLALISGETGYEFYQRIASSLDLYLKAPGRGWLEIGSDQGEGVKNLFHSWKCWVESDWANHDRFFFLEK